ncbi:MAG: S8 family peptidase [Myxococcota bacterium]
MPEVATFLLRVDPKVEIEFLRSAFGFEIVSEQEDGFVVVATEDLDAKRLEQVLCKLEGGERGGGSAAKVYELEDGGSEGRLRRILSRALFESWATLQDEAEYVLDFGIECWGEVNPPNPIERKDGEPEDKWQARQQRFETKWHQAYERWDGIKLARETELTRIIREYSGRVHSIMDCSGAVGTNIPDSFTVRARLTGQAIRDLVLNYPYLFEVHEPDELESGQLTSSSSNLTPQFRLLPPPASAPIVTVVDSGLQEQHPLLAAAVDRASSRCFLNGLPATDVADHVAPAGHGTRVAGAVLYPSGIPVTGQSQAPCWIRNARVLDANNRLCTHKLPGLLLEEVISHQTSLPVPTRIFVHSINASSPCRRVHMSAWGAAIDRLVFEHDIVFVQSSGNLPQASTIPTRPGVREHLSRGRAYPDYLYENSSRLANPAQSLNALTVGSVAFEAFTDGTWTSLAQKPASPSAFSRTGLGLWDIVKPDVVEFGGDLAVDTGNPPSVATPPSLPHLCPELVRSTMHSFGPTADRDDVGTSFAAPKVARTVAAISEAVPTASGQMLRALTVQSARWPTWADGLPASDQLKLIKSIGYGVPSSERGARGAHHRVTLTSEPDVRIHAREGHVYQVRIPEQLREGELEFDVRIEVTLAYAALPRRTRRSHRKYLSTWVDWQTSRANESVESFVARALHERGDSTGDRGSAIPWFLDMRSDHGTVSGVRRNRGTVQKDWAVLASHALPRDFCVAVVGHEGWNKHPEASVPYAICVTMEALETSIPVYEQVLVGVGELQVELGVEVTV